MHRPDSAREAAALLRNAARDGLSARARGGGTKLAWGAPVPEPDVEISTAGLDRIVEHNAGDLTAVLEAGVRLADAQAAFAAAGQMLALDPPLAVSNSLSLGSGGAATVGGIVATADAGPLRHRYGAPRDLLLGVTAALADGTVARAGGKVIKNVAGYDLAKLFAGSFGTLGVIVEVVVRLHPLPRATVTAVGAGDDPAAIARAASALARLPLELESLDVAWAEGRGLVLARAAGAAVAARARAVAGRLAEAGLDARVEEDDEALWEAQRAGQRSADGVVVRVAGLPAELERVLRLADRVGAAAVGRAGIGTVWLRLAPADPDSVVTTVEELRRELAPFPCVVLDAPATVLEQIDVWGTSDAGVARLARRVKERFDPHGVCNPGAFVGGI